MNNTTDIIENLIQNSYMLIDILPVRVPGNSPGRYFSVERFYLKRGRLERIFRSFADLILKLYCYYDICICSDPDDDWAKNPEPDELERRIFGCLPADGKAPSRLHIFIEAENTLIVMDGDELNMTVYNPSENIADMISLLAHGEGLFVRDMPRD